MWSLTSFSSFDFSSFRFVLVLLSVVQYGILRWTWKINIAEGFILLGKWIFSWCKWFQQMPGTSKFSPNAYSIKRQQNLSTLASKLEASMLFICDVSLLSRNEGHFFFIIFSQNLKWTENILKSANISAHGTVEASSCWSNSAFCARLFSRQSSQIFWAPIVFSAERMWKHGFNCQKWSFSNTNSYKHCLRAL